MGMTKIVIFFLIFDFAFILILGLMLSPMTGIGSDIEVAYEVQNAAIERIKQPFSLNPIEAAIQIFLKANALVMYLGAILINPFVTLTMLPTELLLFFGFLFFFQMFIFTAWIISLVWSGKD